MCGIIAWAGKKASQFNKDKFNILAIANDHRGGDGCGITLDSEIFVSSKIGERKFLDFLLKKGYENPEFIPTVIAHVRKTSSGTISDENTHPFGFGNNKKHGGYEFVGVHNGTLLNHEELAKEFDVEMSIYEGTVFKRRKIDSEVLLESMYLNKGYKPLSFYNGAAALVFTDTNNPNVIYAYHGASRAESSDAEEDSTAPYIEERPLYYYKESKNSLYISSTFESLVAIGGTIDENIFEFKHNVVYKITNGDIEEAEKFKIVRKNNYQKKTFVYKNNYNHNAMGYQSQGKLNAGVVKSTNEVRTSTGSEIFEVFHKPLSDEAIPTPNNPSGVYFHNLLYKRNGHPLNGIFLHVHKYGLLRIGDNEKDVVEFFEKNVTKRFCLNSFKFVDDLEKLTSYVIPFIELNAFKPMYIYKGWWCLTSMDYYAFNNNSFTVQAASMAVRHPIKSNVITNKIGEEIFYNGTGCNIDFKPLFSDKKYCFTNGKLSGFKFLRETKAPLLEAKKEEPNVIQDLVKEAVQLKANLEIPKQNSEKGVIKLNNQSSIYKDDDFDDTEYVARNNNQYKENEKDVVDFFPSHPTNNKDFTEEIFEVDDEEVKLVGEILVDLYMCANNTIDELKNQKSSKYIDCVIEQCEDFLLTLQDVVEQN